MYGELVKLCFVHSVLNDLLLLCITLRITVPKTTSANGENKPVGAQVVRLFSFIMNLLVHRYSG